MYKRMKKHDRQLENIKHIFSIIATIMNRVIPTLIFLVFILGIHPSSRDMLGLPVINQEEYSNFSSYVFHLFEYQFLVLLVYVIYFFATHAVTIWEALVQLLGVGDTFLLIIAFALFIIWYIVKIDYFLDIFKVAIGTFLGSMGRKKYNDNIINTKDTK